jgi:predicted ATP-dependent endonuclease of OLD family
MQKIYVKNFGAIPEAEIEIKKILVLIGPQASGKSTIATLIYFFRGLGNNILRQMLRDRNVLYKDFTEVILNRFKELFGVQDIHSSFSITFYFDVEKGKYLMIRKLEGEANLKVDFDTTFFDQPFQNSLIYLRDVADNIQPETDISNRYNLRYEKNIDNFFGFHEFSNHLKRTFFDNFSSIRFIISGRSDN